MRQLEDKVAIVTGAGRGIGRGIALRFAREGARVALVGRSSGPLDQVMSEVEALGGETLSITCDVGSVHDVNETVAQVAEVFGQIDILVNNAQSWGSPLEPPRAAPMVQPEDLP